MSSISGILAAIATPFDGDENLVESALRAHVRRQLDAGIHGIFALGTNGEFYAQSADERAEAARIVIDEVAGAVPVVIGAGAATTRETIAIAADAAAAGADALSIITPYFAAASQVEIENHFRAVADSVDVPVIVYNIPARTGNVVAPATLEKLAAVDNITAVKDSSGNFDTILQYLERTDRETFDVISGNDSLILWTLLAGGAGGISGIANIYPQTMASIYDLFVAGDTDAARTAQDSIRPIRNCLALGNPNTVVKAAANERGFGLGPARAPFNALSDEAKKQVAATVAADVERGLA
ncbi:MULTISPECIES: dihydrodipicolinate synthase family protein [Brevibacterium]|uniref:4-hydroxy-tetrahydrodipicolinate synthase n=1 Tax=Brevibacterium sediminis TaxID=1857024 RepID=A0A5C4WZI4_9MICO|nr:dihydrodipicolinate synthase family protein [Brevibacterium sediminis]TNM53523.1 dihydrodipicolinate synthase family protein [Brevibacterium sediminis]